MVRLGLSSPSPPHFGFQILGNYFYNKEDFKKGKSSLVAERQRNRWEAAPASDHHPGLGNQTDLGPGSAACQLCGL